MFFLLSVFSLPFHIFPSFLKHWHSFICNFCFFTYFKQTLLSSFICNRTSLNTQNLLFNSYFFPFLASLFSFFFSLLLLIHSSLSIYFFLLSTVIFIPSLLPLLLLSRSSLYLLSSFLLPSLFLLPLLVHLSFHNFFLPFHCHFSSLSFSSSSPFKPLSFPLRPLSSSLSPSFPLPHSPYLPPFSSERISRFSGATVKNEGHCWFDGEKNPNEVKSGGRKGRLDPRSAFYHETQWLMSIRGE